ncbi:MAG: hypothetical protein ACJ795_03900 [Ktedonobacteraceae bacterium]
MFLREYVNERLDEEETNAVNAFLPQTGMQRLSAGKKEADGQTLIWLADRSIIRERKYV